MGNGLPVTCTDLASPADCAAGSCLQDFRFDDPACAACGAVGVPACDPADPTCVEPPVADCPAACFACVDRPPPPCELLVDVDCAARADCEWIGGPLLPCGCAPNDPNCICAQPAIAVAPGNGYCQTRSPSCDQYAADVCEANGCAVLPQPDACPPCDPNAGVCNPCDPPPPLCVDVATFCGAQDLAVCAADLRCVVSQRVDCPPCADPAGCPNVDCIVTNICMVAAVPVPPVPLPPPDPAPASAPN